MDFNELNNMRDDEVLKEYEDVVYQDYNDTLTALYCRQYWACYNGQSGTAGGAINGFRSGACYSCCVYFCSNYGGTVSSCGSVYCS